MRAVSETFTFHLAETSAATTIRALVRQPRPQSIEGLRHAECMAVSQLGTSLLSPSRLRLGSLAMFARWESNDAVDRFLAETPLGRRLAVGWHARLEFIRRWGSVAAFADLPAEVGEQDPDERVGALTLARLKLTQVPRFITWGTPVERLVVDHPAALFAVAPMRPVRTVATFSVWRTQREMTDMVIGRGGGPDASRHADAMAARDRKDFHREFTTLRFRILSEHGEWNGAPNIVSAAR